MGNLQKQYRIVKNSSRVAFMDTFLRTNKPSVQTKKFSWQIQHEENLTGTKKAYKPDGSLINDLKKDMKKYESWKP